VLQPILVVGATGTLGSRLVRQLAAAGVKPRALVRSREKGEAIASLATPVIGDLLAPETLAPAFRGVERVFVIGKPTPDMETLERNAIDAAAAAGARRIVYLSNFTAKEGSEQRPMHVHGLHERLVASLGVDWTVLGPTRYMTNVPFVWSSVLNQGLLLEAGGSGVMSFIDPDDVATVAVKALTEDGHEGQTYRLTSEDAYTAADLARLLSKVVGRGVRIFEGDLEALRDALIANGAPGEHAPVMAKYFDMVAAGLYETTDTLGKLLGRAPRAYADWLPDNLPAVRRAAAQ
jgi:(4-alkanoyl-5-oxo-2,5-dihydrofuran-3-yl)methyl phosphate reductase